MFTHNFFSPVYHDADDGGGGDGGAPVVDDGIEIPEGVDPAEILAGLGAGDEATEFEVPETLPEGVETFDRNYVEQLRQEAAARRVAAKELTDKYGDLDPEAARQALGLTERLTTREGVVELTEAALESLGMEPEDIAKLVASFDPDAIDEDDPDLDVPMTKREFLEEQRKSRLTAAQLAQEERQSRDQETFNAAAKDQIVSAFTALKVDDEAERQVLLTIGDQVATEHGIDQTDVSKIPAVLTEAKKRYDAQVAAAARRVIEAKVGQKVTTPKLLGGGGTDAGGGEAPNPNRTLAEVIADRKARDKAAQGR